MSVVEKVFEALLKYEKNISNMKLDIDFDDFINSLEQLV
jgi:hypothetical protein